MPKVFEIGPEIPLVGHIAFGLVDRGTNLIQVRPTTLCPLSCIFCSVDAGPKSRRRATEYVVDLEHLVESFKALVEYKGIEDAQAHIDAVGDPLTYSRIVDLVQELGEIEQVKVVSMETHGALLNERILEELDSAGLSRLNLSIDSTDPDVARYLAGAEWLDVRRILELAEYAAQNLRMDLLIAPVWIPGVNDVEVEKLIEFAIRIGAGKKWPPLGIQKYEVHKYGRKVRGVKPMTWYEFYQRLRELERRYGVRLVLNPMDFGIHKAKRLPLVFRRYERATVEVAGPGWLKGEWIGIARGRCVAIVGVGSEDPPIGSRVKVRVLRNKHNVYVAELD